MLRKRITLAINRNDTFSLSFDAEAPQDARRVTARLASLFIEENLKVREQQAAGTTSFINTEAERLRKELEDQEARVNKYRAQYWYELPENRDANSRAIAQFQRELENGIYRITSLQDRKAALEKQLAESDVYERELVKLGNGGREQAALQSPQKIDRYRELEDLLKKYSERHPDVIRLKREIQAMGSAPVTVESSKPVTKPSDSTVTSLRAMLAGQISELNSEIAALQTKNNSLNAQISMLQSRVDNTPLRAVELSKITRDYDITLRKYQDLLGKSLESELSENMEKKQKGEQFQIVDPAHLPQKPVAPNRPRILLIGLLLALGGGVGAAFLLDNLDKSFKTNEDLVSQSSVPLLAVLPAVPTRGMVSERRQARMVLVLGSLAVLAIGLVLGPYVGTFLLYR
jgi:polysaccharide chain length determinant protein (PEP-CTERM system associated)